MSSKGESCFVCVRETLILNNDGLYLIHYFHDKYWVGHFKCFPEVEAFFSGIMSLRKEGIHLGKKHCICFRYMVKRKQKKNSKRKVIKSDKKQQMKQTRHF